MSMANAQRIIIALDVQTKEDAFALVSRLKDARTFKVGLELFTAEGPTLFRKLKSLRKDLFLDLKLHDIPNTVAGAVRSAFKHGVQMMTIHTSGGREMMVRAAEAARAAAEAAQGPRPLLLGVTVLTSLKGPDLAEVWPRRRGWTASSVRPRRSRSCGRSTARTWSSSRRASGRSGRRPGIRSGS
jgi:orotidine-5'-phosphate decarboxylase